ncbi:peptidoglycan DD-metalloendopeptidase family protein [Gallaecimonas sp. GXIMD1310]|uniref:peptidoglycan DD-metalloendopeptidase family protein n=1 Tax=Gallaecimonas sp. GXIMD1310 TaxID=3131926 RepID=UPI00324D74C3
MSWRQLTIGLLCLLLSACAAKRPAPVISLSRNLPVAQVVNYERISGHRYRVHEGDTLYSIAFRAGWDYRELAQRNHLRVPYTIYPGQLLYLNQMPSSAVAVSTKAQKNNKKTFAKSESHQYSQSHGVNKNATSAAENQAIDWRWPTTGPLLLGFEQKQNGNKGLDIGGKRGDPVVAAASGKVVYAGSALRGYGKLVIIKHNDTYLSAYAHNDKLLVKEQQWVKAGQEIARKGDSGSNAIQLHFEIRRRGQAINPLLKLPKRGQQQ